MHPASLRIILLIAQMPLWVAVRGSPMITPTPVGMATAWSAFSLPRILAQKLDIEACV